MVMFIFLLLADITSRDALPRVETHGHASLHTWFYKANLASLASISALVLGSMCQADLLFLAVFSTRLKSSAKMSSGMFKAGVSLTT